MNAPTDPRAEARALMDWCRKRLKSQNLNGGELILMLDNSLAALEAALEREEQLPEVTMPDHDTCLGIGKMARDLMTGRIQYDGHIIEATLLWLEAEGKIRVARREEPKS